MKVKDAEKHQNDANPPPYSSSRTTPKKLTALQAAYKEVQETEKHASDAKKKTKQARADALRIRQSYAKCLSEKESQ